MWKILGGVSVFEPGRQRKFFPLVLPYINQLLQDNFWTPRFYLSSYITLNYTFFFSNISVFLI